MSDLREAAQQALEALGLWATGRDMDAVALNDLIFRLEAALAGHECHNCASLEAQNTELDRKLADLEQTSLELCKACGWRTLIPAEGCLNCARSKLAELERKPLTEEEIAEALAGLLGFPHKLKVEFARDIERAHGIGEKE